MHFRFADFSREEKWLWTGSVTLLVFGFFLWDRVHYFTLFSSLIGITSLLFNAKGHPLGPFLMIFFSLCYGILSHAQAYYGEMITYLGMTLPMSVLSLISWLKHPHEKGKPVVRIRKLRKRDLFLLTIASLLVTLLFYFILKEFHTARLPLSTLSVTTSFLAVAFTALRSPYYALGYAANDAVLILLWALAAAEDPSALSVTICFVLFLVSDLYGFFRWKKRERRQALSSEMSR